MHEGPPRPPQTLLAEALSDELPEGDSEDEPLHEDVPLELPLGLLLGPLSESLSEIKALLPQGIEGPSLMDER